MSRATMSVPVTRRLGIGALLAVSTICVALGVGALPASAAPGNAHARHARHHATHQHPSARVHSAHSGRSDTAVTGAGDSTGKNRSDSAGDSTGAGFGAWNSG